MQSLMESFVESFVESTPRLTKTLCGGALLAALLCSGSSYAAGPAALRGVVRSQQEGLMEGVLVSARRQGSNVTVTVISDSRGRYSFPADHLAPGSYGVKIRAIGYDLADPGAVTVAAGKTTDLDLMLEPTQNLAAQMTNAEWFLSDPEIKKVLIDGMRGVYSGNCIACHPISVIMNSRYKGEQWLPILGRMHNYSEASLYQPGALGSDTDLRIRVNRPNHVASKPIDQKFADFLSSINLSSHPDGKWGFDLKTLPRVTGRSTRVIITEWDLPRRSGQPHDAIVDRQGLVWYTDVGNGYIGRLNPKTGEIKEWKTPEPDPSVHDIAFTFDIKLDRDGNPIVGSSAGILKFDRKTEKFTVWREMPGGMVALSPQGMIWSKDAGNYIMYRLNPKTGEIRKYPFAKKIRFYGIEADGQGNVYGASLQSAQIGKLDGKTGQWEFFETPTPDSGPRRADVDAQGRFWFAEYYAGNIGMFDPETKKIQEWPIPPTPWSGPYDVVADKNGEVWAAGEFADNVYRLNPSTGAVTTYPLPTLEMNVQRIDVDSSTSPVTVWVSQNHKSRIARVEPLD